MSWPRGRSLDGGVDEIPLGNAVPGRLFLCGKHAVGPDAAGLLDRIGATAVVCLNERYELEDRYPDFVAWLQDNQPARAVHHPIPDLHAPALDEFAALIEALHTRLDAGETLVVNCGAGIGRTGTVAAGILVRTGMALDDALEVVRSNRPMAGPEVGAQRDVLTAYAEAVGAG